jgi:hypothetical protein|tara:strand:- start:2178 stop:2864 length:687 start_codon:yes stop_codon:yes gene_type:complete
MPAHANVRPELKAAHEAFGKSLGMWLKSQGISQQIPHTWSLERRKEGIDDATPGPHNSSTSQLVRGIALPAGVGVFHALENFNRAVAEKDLRGIKTRRIRDILTEAEPFMTVDGRVADMMDFLAMFAGRQEIAEQYQPGSGYSEEDAKEATQKQRKAFKEQAQEQMLSPAEAWSAIEERCDCIGDKAMVSKFKKVLSGWEEWTAEELNQPCASTKGTIGDALWEALNN